MRQIISKTTGVDDNVNPSRVTQTTRHKVVLMDIHSPFLSPAGKKLQYVVPKRPAGSRSFLSILAGDTSARLMIGPGTVTLVLLIALVEQAYCGENSMTENYGDTPLVDISRRNHACANRISRRTVCTGI